MLFCDMCRLQFFLVPLSRKRESATNSTPVITPGRLASPEGMHASEWPTLINTRINLSPDFRHKQPEIQHQRPHEHKVVKLVNCQSGHFHNSKAVQHNSIPEPSPLCLCIFLCLFLSLSLCLSPSPFLPLLCSLFQANRRMLRVIFTLEWGAASGRIRGERGGGWGSHIMATEGLQGTAEGTKALPLSPMPDAARSSAASAGRE
jgi:hypothetical protein